MQPLTPDFLAGQLRVALIAFTAYGSGKGWFSPTDAGFYLGMFTAFSPIVIPWAFSIWATLGTVKVPAGMIITKDDIQAASGNGAAPAAAVIDAAKKAAPVILLCLLILPLAACTTAQKQAGTNAAATVIRSVPDLQSRTAYLCKFVPAAEVVAAIFRVDSGTIGQIATGICNSLKTQVATYGIMAREPSYKGVILRGKFVP